MNVYFVKRGGVVEHRSDWLEESVGTATEVSSPPSSASSRVLSDRASGEGCAENDCPPNDGGSGDLG